jgi:hypothetical protein
MNAPEQYGANNGTAYGSVSRVNDTDKGDVLRVPYTAMNATSQSYVQFPDGFFDGHDNVTISMDIKVSATNNGTGNNHSIFCIGRDQTDFSFLRVRTNSVWFGTTTNGNGAGLRGVTATGSWTGSWMNITIVLEGNNLKLYRNGTQIGENQNVTSLTSLGTGLISYLGRFFFTDNIIQTDYDNVKVFLRSLSAEEVYRNANTDFPIFVMDSGGHDVQARIINASKSSAKDLRFLAAAYDAAGRLVELKSSTVNGIAAETLTAKQNFDFSSDLADKTVKGYIWNESNYTPDVAVWVLKE